MRIQLQLELRLWQVYVGPEMVGIDVPEALARLFGHLDQVLRDRPDCLKKQGLGMWLTRKMPAKLKIDQADVFWAWVLHQRDQGRLMGMFRAERGHAHLPRAAWESASRNLLVRMGLAGEHERTSQSDLRDLELSTRIRRAILDAMSESEEDQVIVMETGTLQQAWQTVKRALPGPTGYAAFQRSVSAMMTEGSLQGALGVSGPWSQPG